MTALSVFSDAGVLLYLGTRLDPNTDYKTLVRNKMYGLPYSPPFSPDLRLHVRSETGHTTYPTAVTTMVAAVGYEHTTPESGESGPPVGRIVRFYVTNSALSMSVKCLV